MTTEDDDNVFGEPISVYTDQDAVEDGILVQVNARDRVTRNAWEWLVEFTPISAEPPANWPVEIMGWFRTKPSKEEARQIAKGGREALDKHEREVRDKKALALATGLIEKERRTAMHVYENNVGGGIHKAIAAISDKHNHIGVLYDGDWQGELQNAKTLWLIPNEQGGITLMFPEDY